MILYALVCSRKHEFEGWFRSAADFETQAEADDVACPVCGDQDVRRAPSAPALVSGKGGEEQARKLRQALVELRKHVESTSDYVGERFPEEARRIHYGEVEKRSIYGEASAEDARELNDEGIEIAVIPWPSLSDS